MLRLKYSSNNYIELYNGDLLIFRTSRLYPPQLIFSWPDFEDEYQLIAPSFTFKFENNKLICSFSVQSSTRYGFSEVLYGLNYGGNNNPLVYEGPNTEHISISIKPEFYNVDLNSAFFRGCGSEGLSSRIYFNQTDFETDLYPELLDNEETKLQLQNWINDTNPTWDQYSDKDIKAMELIEKYNKNVLLLRSTLKVDSSVSGSISQSGQSQTVDLTATNNALNNIANKLKRTETIDNQEVEKNITQTINELNLSNQTVITTVEKAPYNPLLDDGSDIDF